MVGMEKSRGEKRGQVRRVLITWLAIVLRETKQIKFMNTTGVVYKNCQKKFKKFTSEAENNAGVWSLEFGVWSLEFGVY